MDAVLPIFCLQALLLGSAEQTAAVVPEPSPDGPLFASSTQLDRIGRIVAPAMINGKGPFRLVVDTGASESTISPHLAEVLGLAATAEVPVLVNGVTGSAQLPSALVERIQAGSLVIERARVPVIWSSIMADADGILGVAGLREERVLVDFARDRVAISRSHASGAPMGYFKIPATRLPGGLLAVSARIGGVRAQAIIDTGSERTLGNSALRDALRGRRRPLSKQDSVATSVYGATQEVSDGELQTAPRIELGGVNISEVSVVFGDFHIFDVWNLQHRPALIIGMDVLGTLRALEIDFRQSELYLDPIHHGPASVSLTR